MPPKAKQHFSTVSRSTQRRRLMRAYSDLKDWLYYWAEVDCMWAYPTTPSVRKFQLQQLRLGQRLLRNILSLETRMAVRGRKTKTSRSTHSCFPARSPGMPPLPSFVCSPSTARDHSRATVRGDVCISFATSSTAQPW